MSLKSFLNNIMAGISHIFHSLVDYEKKAVHIGVTVTEAIKTFDAKNPMVADFVTAMIPGTIDDLIKEKIRAAVPKVFDKLKLVEGSNSDLETLKNSLIALQALPAKELAMRLNDISIMLTDVAADGKIDWNDLAYLPKWYYDNEFSKAQPVATAKPTIA